MPVIFLSHFGRHKIGHQRKLEFHFSFRLQDLTSQPSPVVRVSVGGNDGNLPQFFFRAVPFIVKSPDITMPMCEDKALKATAILLGRMGSTRLPGKVFLPLAGKPVIQHVYERILNCRNIDRIIVATTKEDQDDCIVELFDGLGVAVFRGSNKDPLDRYYQAATEYRASDVVRIMSDCPLVDPGIVDLVIEKYFDGNLDLCSLGGEFPSGLDVTVFSYQALQRCWRDSRLASDREHITSYMSKNPHLFKLGVVDFFQGLLHHRWTMDREADYQFMLEIYGALYDRDSLFDYEDILNLLDEKPQLYQINADLPRDEGIRTAVDQDYEMY